MLGVRRRWLTPPSSSPSSSMFVRTGFNAAPSTPTSETMNEIGYSQDTLQQRDVDSSESMATSGSTNEMHRDSRSNRTITRRLSNEEIKQLIEDDGSLTKSQTITKSKGKETNDDLVEISLGPLELLKMAFVDEYQQRQQQTKAVPSTDVKIAMTRTKSAPSKSPPQEVPNSKTFSKPAKPPQSKPSKCHRQTQPHHQQPKCLQNQHHARCEEKLIKGPLISYLDTSNTVSTTTTLESFRLATMLQRSSKIRQQQQRA
ncbi:hypothetical protein HDU76_009421 [Blyttiomyces sp. JEL0837]|nr:hypothetical protein HDU76_009421 [Blyttiomyces sp. JEL0837]